MIVSPDSEKDLLLLIVEGDEKAFRKIFDLYWNKIYTVAITLTKSDALAEELVQDIFLKIWLNRKDLTTVNNFSGFLFIIARNLIFNELRKKTSEQQFVEHLEQYFLESSLLPDKLMQLKETTRLVDEAVEKLPEQQRMVYKLSRHEGLDYNTIATHMNITRSTVKNHMTKALQTLRQHLIKNLGELVISIIIFQVFK